MQAILQNNIDKTFLILIISSKNKQINRSLKIDYKCENQK